MKYKHYTMEECTTEIEARGGIFYKFDFEKDKNNRKSFKIKCAAGHIFYLSPREIFRPRYCPKCNNSLGENMLREFFEGMYPDYKFPCIWPETLVNRSGNRMHLDLYCKELNMAVEYDGNHHDGVDVYNIKDEKKLKNISTNDEDKDKWALDNGIIMVRIKDFTRLLKGTEKECILIIRERVRSEFVNYGIEHLLPINFHSMTPSIYSAYRVPHNLRQYKKICNIVNKKDGTIISKTYISNRVKMHFKCKYGSNSYIEPNTIIKSGFNCPCKICSGKEPWNLKKCREFCSDNGYEFLSNIYNGQSSEYILKCDKLHVFSITWKSFLSSFSQNLNYKPACKVCNSTQKISFEEVTEYLLENGYKILTDRNHYSDTKTALKANCPNGSIFESNYNDFQTKHKRCRCDKCIISSGNWKLSDDISLIRDICKSSVNYSEAYISFLKKTSKQPSYESFRRICRKYNIEIIFSNEKTINQEILIDKFSEHIKEVFILSKSNNQARNKLNEILKEYNEVSKSVFQRTLKILNLEREKKTIDLNSHITDMKKCVNQSSTIKEAYELFRKKFKDSPSYNTFRLFYNTL